MFWPHSASLPTTASHTELSCLQTVEVSEAKKQFVLTEKCFQNYYGSILKKTRETNYRHFHTLGFLHFEKVHYLLHFLSTNLCNTSPPLIDHLSIRVIAVHWILHISTKMLPLRNSITHTKKIWENMYMFFSTIYVYFSFPWWGDWCKTELLCNVLVF